MHPPVYMTVRQLEDTMVSLNPESCSQALAGMQ